MDCKTTSPTKRLRSGFTLTEVLASLAIGGICAAALVSFSLFSGRGLLAMSNHLELEAQARKTIDNLIKEIRLCRGVTAYTTNSITFANQNNAALKFTYDPTARTLSRTLSSATTVLLTGCDSLSFALYDRDMSSGSLDLIPATSISDCKGVQVSWSCSRTFIDSKLNAANITTATVVMRLK